MTENTNTSPDASHINDATQENNQQVSSPLEQSVQTQTVTNGPTPQKPLIKTNLQKK